MNRQLCNRSYSCGRSLGGHMRSHPVDAPPPEAEEAAHNTLKFASLCDYSDDDDEEEEQVDDKDSSVGSFKLRENSRKKSKRAEEDPGNTKISNCVKCGKEFQSQKALCGHMACHSEKKRSWNVSTAHKGNKKSAWSDQKFVMDSHSNNETGAASDLTLRRRRSKRIDNVAASAGWKPSLDDNGRSWVSVVENEQEEEVAKCLMMLSSGKWNSAEDSLQLSGRMEDSSETRMSPPTPDLRKGIRAS